MQGKITIELESIGDTVEMSISANVSVDSVLGECVSKILIIREIMHSLKFTVLEAELLQVGLVDNSWPDSDSFTPVNANELDKAIRDAILGLD